MLPYIDFLFVAAFITLGFGVSLATYRIFALRNDWPMGELHANKPLVPILLGAFLRCDRLPVCGSAAVGAPTGDFDGWWIILFGFIWGFVWTGMMRVGSQISLFLAPLATLILMMSWVGVRTPPGYVLDQRFVPHVYVADVPLPERAPYRTSTPARRLAQDFGPEGENPQY